MTRDPIALHVAQPLVDRLHLSPRSASERCADVFLLVAITVDVVRVATVTLPGIWLAAAAHLIVACFMRDWCRRTAAMGQAVLATPEGLIHMLFRICLLLIAALEIRNVAVSISIGLAPLVPISFLRWNLDLIETLSLLSSLYMGICREPPPRRRRKTMTTARA